jgi:hypothetical protein
VTKESPVLLDPLVQTVNPDQLEIVVIPDNKDHKVQLVPQVWLVLQAKRVMAEKLVLKAQLVLLVHKVQWALPAFKVLLVLWDLKVAVDQKVHPVH